MNPNQMRFVRIRASDMLLIDQNTAIFFNCIVYDEQFGGLAFESEGIRCAGMMRGPLKQVMGNLGCWWRGRLFGLCRRGDL